MFEGKLVHSIPESWSNLEKEKAGRRRVFKMFGSLAKFTVFILVGIWLLIAGYISWQYVIKPRRSLGKSSPRRRQRSGKRCPQCRNLIDARRTVCQHCGHIFKTVPKPEAEAKPKNGHSGKKHKRGKRCPQCQTMIDYQRTVCQHCGFVFFESRQNAPNSNPSPPLGSSGDGT